VEPASSQRIVRFGLFELDVVSGELRKQGLKVRLPDQPLQILMLLLEHPGEVITREALRQRLWHTDTFVDFDTGLNSAMKKLRDALAESAETPRFIETLPRRGYRFIAGQPEVVMRGPDRPPEGPLARPSRIRLRRRLIAAGAVAAVVAALGIAGWWQRVSRGAGLGAASTQIKSIAVLPFENLSGDVAQDYFVDGMTDALITNLAQIGSVRVISRTSAMQYKHAKKPLPQIARELNIDAVVEGAVVRVGDRVRITAQLIHAQTDRHLWAQTYERELRNVLALQADVAGAIANAVQAGVRPEERRRPTRFQAVHPGAYDEYLRGRFYWSNRSPESLLQAAEHFQRAIESDPTYAPAYSGLSDTYRLFDLMGLAAPRECMPKAKAAARKALAIDDTLAEAHASLAGVLYRYDWDWERAEKEFQRSLELDPNYAEVHRGYGVYLLTLRRHDEALTALQRAVELSPLSAVINIELAHALRRLERYDDAIGRMHKTLEIDPNFFRGYVELALTHLQLGDTPRAVSELQRAAALSPEFVSPLPWLGYAYGAAGRRPQAVKVLAELENLSQRHYVSPQSFAVVHLGLGQKQQTLGFLEKAYEERAFEILGFSGPLFDLLHNEPQFRDLLRRMGLAGRPGYS
jgi:TolB-like protein/DNA-binding winged helix-turn-helix (wHTH) protein/Flp pilus assembly protein TadD